MTLTNVPKRGPSFDYYQRITVTWNTFGGNSSDGYQPDLIVPFSTQGILMLNEDSTSVIEVSFNGTTVHDRLDPANPSRGVSYDNRVVSLVWFRLASGASAVVSFRAWATR